MSRAKWRPSELEKLELCVAYRGSAMDTSTSAEGTMLHQVMEDMMKHPECEPAILNTLTEEHLGLVRFATGAVMELISQSSCSVTTAVEVSLDLFNRGRVRIRGKADLILIEPNMITVIDYKFGRLPVTPADGNLQGWCYALGAFCKYGCTQVKMVFIAPHFQEVSTHVFHKDDIPKIVTRIAAVVSKCQAGGDPTPHPSACQYCAQKMYCPAIAERALAVSTHFAGVAIPTQFFPGPDTTPDQRNIAQHLAGILADWGELWKKSNREAVLENGVELADFALRSRAGARQVIDVGATWRILEGAGCSLDTLLSACKVSVGELESALVQEEKGGNNGVKGRVLEALETAGIMVSNPDMVYLQRKPKADLGVFINSLNIQHKEIESHGN